MIDPQIWTHAVANIPVVLVVGLGMLINNSRLNDVRDVLRAEMARGAAELRTEMARGAAEMRTDIARNHSELLAKFMEMDHRIEKLENSRWK